MIKYQRYIDLIDQVLQEMNPEDPYAGQCYVASAALKKLVGRELRCIALETIRSVSTGGWRPKMVRSLI